MRSPDDFDTDAAVCYETAQLGGWISGFPRKYSLPGIAENPLLLPGVS